MTGLRAQNLWLSRGRHRVLRDVSLSVSAGEFVALVGPNGAGKSTLLHCLAAQLRPTRGRCMLDGVGLDRASASDLARRRAVLPQEVTIGFPLRVKDVVELGRAPWRRRVEPRDNAEAIAWAVATTGITPLMGRDYRDLSGGERQRVQLARVLAQVWKNKNEARQPRYLLLDEPTSSLDIGHQQRLLGMVRAVVADGIGVLAVMHDLNLTAAFADRVYLLARGRLVTTGTPTEVIRTDIISQTYGARVDVDTNPRTGRRVVLPAV